MSNITTLQALLKAADLIKRPFKTFQMTSQSLENSVDSSQQKLASLQAQAGQIEKLLVTQRELIKTQKAMNMAKANARERAIAVNTTSQPSRQQIVAMNTSRSNVRNLADKYTDLQLSLQRQNLQLKAAGINTQHLAESELQLQKSITHTSADLEQQQEKLKRFTSLKQKISTVKDQYQQRTALAAAVKSRGERGFAFANTIIAPRAAANAKNSASVNPAAIPANQIDSPIATVPNAGNLDDDIAKLVAAKEKLSTDWLAPQADSLRQLVQTATESLLKLDSWVIKNQELVQIFSNIAAAATIVASVIGVIGTVTAPVITAINMIMTTASLLVPIFEDVALAIGTLSWPVVAVVAAITGAALLIRQYWEPLSTFFKGVLEPLKPLFNWLDERLQSISGWFSNLITPVKSSQQTLDAFRDSGEKLGKILADSMTQSLMAIRRVKDAFSSVLEYLHLKDKTSKTADTLPVSDNNAYVDNFYLQKEIVPLSTSAYQPVIPQASRTITDRSTQNITLQITAEQASAEDIASHIRTQLERFQSEKYSNHLTSLVY